MIQCIPFTRPVIGHAPFALGFLKGLFSPLSLPLQPVQTAKFDPFQHIAQRNFCIPIES